jgi:hypothetical protein
VWRINLLWPQHTHLHEQLGVCDGAFLVLLAQHASQQQLQRRMRA